MSLTGKKRLPLGVKVIGWVGLLGGLWNVLLIPLALTQEQHPGSPFSQPALRTVVVCWMPVAALWVIASIGLLFGRQWARKLVIVAGLLFGLVMGAHVVVSQILLWKAARTAMSVGVGLASGGVAFVVLIGLIYLLIRYLSKPQIRQAFH